MPRRPLSTTATGRVIYPLRIGRARRVIAWVSLLGLVGIMGGYWYLTDSQRVKAIAQAYLQRVLKSPVTIKSADLSLFRGLTLRGIEVLAPERPAIDEMPSYPAPPESRVLFTAAAFDVRFDLFSLIRGDLSAGSILAIDPHLRLIVDLDRQDWNFQPLLESRDGSRGPATTQAAKSAPQIKATTAAQPARESLGLPEMLLRNGRVDYGEIEHGKYRAVGSVLVNGKMLPAGSGRYAFELQARGNARNVNGVTLADEAGPSLSGQVQLATGRISGQVKNFELGPDVRAMLPVAVRQWWQRHELSGRIDVPEFSFVPARKGAEPTFRIVTVLDGAQITLHPDELRSTAENKNIDLWHHLATAAGIRSGGGVLARLGRGSDHAFTCRDLTGTFTFSDRAIEFDTRASLDNIRITAKGRLEGYNSDVPFEATLASDEAHPLELTGTPGFVPILPPEIREVYDRFAPSGLGSFKFNVKRTEVGGRNLIDGQLRIEDGRFSFEEMPYPLVGGNGVIAITPDKRGGTRLEIQNVTGHGPLGSANTNANISVNGTMWPLEGGAGVDILIKGEGLVADKQLKAALPPEVREVLKEFDPVGDGVLPQFQGGFTSSVHRDLGPVSHWTIDVDIDFHDGAGRFASFPYPLADLSGKVLVRRNRVEIRDVAMKRHGPDGGGHMALNGEINWRQRPKGDTAPLHMNYDLSINASAVPIDTDLLHALPSETQEGMKWLGATGLVDVKGKVTGTVPDLHFDLALSNGTITPDGGPWSLSGVSADLTLAGHRLAIHSLTGNHNGSPVKISGEVLEPVHAGVNVSGQPATGSRTPLPSTAPAPFDLPPMRLQVDAPNLEFDPALRRILPTEAQTAWDEVQPLGTADLKVSYSFDGPLDLVLAPRTLSLKPRALPIRWNDVKGGIHVHGTAVTLSDLTGSRVFPPNRAEGSQSEKTKKTAGPEVEVQKSGQAQALLSTASEVRISGTGNLASPSRWQLNVGVTDLPLNAEVKAALPEMLKSTVDSIGLGGLVNLRLPDLQLVSNPTAAAPDALDLSFAMGMTLRDGSLSVQMPVTEAQGGLTLAGVVRQGRLVSLDGNLSLERANVAGRELTGASAHLRRPSDLSGLVIEDIRGRMSDGDIDGTLVLAFPDDNSTRYTLNILLRDADAALVSGLADSGMVGRFSGSLGLEGTAGQPVTQRGRGDVRVSGTSLVKIPLVLGFVQVANLTLPDATPFNEATMRYVVEGRKIRIEALSLTSPSLEMKGKGLIDLGAGKVLISLTPTNTHGWSVPVLSDLIDPARRELLTIVIRGSVEHPKVSARSFGTLTTTIDQITRPTGGVSPDGK